jgi:putative inorganic carbon (HCO3(-)) transporter
MRPLFGAACLALLPLAVWPGLERPFFLPKLVWLVSATIAVVLLRPARAAVGAPPAPDAAHRASSTLAWLVATWMLGFIVAGLAGPLPSLEALALGLAAPLFALTLTQFTDAYPTLLAGQVVGATACAAVALSQWAGADPFAAAGWQPAIEGASIRMRVYGTLGNPNFVGVLMAMTLPLTMATLSSGSVGQRRVAAWAALGLQAAALVATGSRGAVLGLAAAVAVYATLRWSRRVRLGLAAVALFAAVAVAVSPARPIDTTAAGRLHLWRIAWPRVREAPLVGQGPGAVTLRFPDWQRNAAREGVRDRRFAGLTDHVHNDFLETLVERGLVGLVSLVAPLVVLGVQAFRMPRPVAPVPAGTMAAIAAGAACALVDFPLARPTELAWWWVAIAIALRARPTPTSVTGAPESRFREA